MTTNKTQRKPSLIHPDLSGLWSVAKLGQNKTYWSRLAGFAVMSIFLYSWIFGIMLPFFTLYLTYAGYRNVAMAIFLVASSPYLLPISPQPWISRLYMIYGAHYFEGGCSMSFESEPKVRNPDIPMCCPAHPHGLFCIAYFLSTGIRFRAIDDIQDTEKKKQIVGRISECNHIRKRLPYKGILDANLVQLPLFNLAVCKLTGCIESSDRQNMKAIMRQKVSFGILPGGFDEATLFNKGEHAISMKRKGFIKYCLQFGYEIVPVYLFGESETYHNLFYSDSQSNYWINRAKWWLNKKRIPTIFPIGQYWFSPFLPFRDIGLHSIFSKNTRCQQFDNPTQEQIDEVHQWYANEIVAVFERNKWRFGYGDETKLKVL
eukprot:106994_1